MALTENGGRLYEPRDQEQEAAVRAFEKQVVIGNVLRSFIGIIDINVRN